MLMTMLCGCMQENENTENSVPENEIPKAEQLFQCTELTQPEEGTDLLSIEYHEGTLYVLQSVSDENGTASYSMHTYDESGKNTMLFDYQSDEGDAYVSDFCITSDSCFAFLVQKGSNPDMLPEEDNPDFDWDAYWEGYVYSGSLEILSAKGELLSSIETPAGISVRQDENGDFLMLSNGFHEKSPAYLIKTDGAAIELTDIGNEVIGGFCKGADQSLLIMISGTAAALKKWDAAAAEFTDVPLSDDSIFLSGLIPGCSSKISCYLQSDQGIYAVSDDGSLSEAVNFMDSGISDTSGSQIVCTGENTFIGIMRSSTGGTYLAKIAPITEEQQQQEQEAKILTLGCYFTDSDLSQAISEFNRSQKEYRIQVEDYSRYGESDDEDANYEKGMLRLNEDIAAGNAPDILVLFQNSQFNPEESGAFLDLYEVMGTNDTHAKEDFLPNYLKMLETDGKLYQIGTAFAINTQFANADMAGGKESWTTTEFLEICRQCDAQGIEIMGYQTKENFMNMIISGDQFIDLEKGVCYFDDPVFLEALKFSEEMEQYVVPDFANMTEDEIDASATEDSAKCMNGQRMLESSWVFSRLYDYMLINALFGDIPAVMIGNPTRDGSSGHYLTPSNEMYSISSTCEYPEIAWEFISTQMYMDPEFTASFSVIDETLRQSLQHDLEEINSFKHVGLNGIEMEMREITQEDVDMIYKLILSLEKRSAVQNPASDIYNDVMQGFYDGTKTPEQTAEELQERVGLYLKENQ